MKINELNKLKKKEKQDLEKISADNKIELVKIRAEVSAGNENNNKKIKNLKRDIAQILTVIREKELLEEVSEKIDVDSKKQT